VRFDHLGLRLALLAVGCAVSIYLWRFLPTLRTVDETR
jgi:hypothetical protein